MSKFRWIGLALAATLTACGGGGDNSSIVPTVTSTADFPLHTAWVNHVSGSRSLSFTVSGSVNGTNVAGSGTGTQSSLVSTTFEGTPALRGSTTQSMTLNPGNVTIASTSYGYVDSNYNYLGSSSDEEYAVVTSREAIPASAKVNANGIWHTENRYRDISKSVFLGTETTSFSLEPDTAETALLKIIQVQKNAGGTVTGNFSATYRLTKAGALTRLSETGFTTTPAAINLTISFN